MVQSLPPARDITQDDRNELLIPIASGVKELLFAPVNPFNNRPGFVSGPPPDTGLARAVRDITRLNCRIWASKDKSNYSPRVNQGNGEICGPYLDQLGENPVGGSILPPFQGGQCITQYRVRYSWDTVLTSGEVVDQGLEETTPAIPGPISGFTFQNQPGNSFIAITFGAPATTEIFRFSPAPQGAFANARLEEITRADGLPDNCGNPDAVVQPTGTVVPTTPIVPTINIDLPGIGPITVNVDLDPIGRPIIIAPDIGAEITIAPEFGVNPDVDVSLGGGGGGGAPPLDPEIGEPIESPPGGGGGGDDTGFGEPPEGRIWVGAYVQLLGDFTPFGVIPRDLVGQAALPTVVGNASLNVDTDSSVVLRSTFTQIRSEWSEHIVPVVGLPVTGIRVKVNPALGYRVYPVSVADPLAEST